MRAVLVDSIEAAGFEAYRKSDIERIAGELGFPAQRKHILDQKRDGPEHLIKFHGVIEVVYTREEEDEAFLRWQGWTYNRSPQRQRSWFELTNGPTIVDSQGEVLDPYGVTVYGYFAFERIADEVPKEYGL